MSKKDFEKGITAAVKTNEAFMKKQAKATEELGKRIIEKIDEHGQIIEVILDTLNNQEKKELYDLDSADDIADLGDNEKEVLVSYLLTLISKHEQNTDRQEDYFFAVKKHLGVTDVSDNLDLTLVENVDSRSERKVMFQTVCEFLFLKTGDTSFLDTFKDQLDCFDLNPKTVAEIISSIEKIYDILGLRGIVEHYIPAEPEEEVFPEHYGLVNDDLDEVIIDDGNREINAGEERVFKNQRVIILKPLTIYGKAIFKNCEIVSDCDAKIAIHMEDSEHCYAEFISCEFIIKRPLKAWFLSVAGYCLIRDSKVSGQKYLYGMCDGLFKYANGNAVEFNRCFAMVGPFNSKGLLSIEHCLIENCEGTFVQADGNSFSRNHKIMITQCEIKNHKGNFLWSRFPCFDDDTGINITDTVFKNCSPLKTREEFNTSHESSWDYAKKFPNFDRLICSSFEIMKIKGSKFVSCNMNPIVIDDYTDVTEDIYIENCEFDDVDFDYEHDIDSYLQGHIANCIFSNCRGYLYFGRIGAFSNNVTKVNNLTFKNYDGFVNLTYGKIEHCKFMDSKVCVVVEGKGDNTEKYISEGNDIIFDKCILKKDDRLHTGTSLEVPALLKPYSYLGKNHFCVRFNYCKFVNCTIPLASRHIATQIKDYGTFGKIKIFTVAEERYTEIN